MITQKVTSLIDKSAAAETANEALTLSQAALNLANALLILKQVRELGKKPSEK